MTKNMKKELVNSFFEYVYESKENTWFLGVGNPIPWSVDKDIIGFSEIFTGKYQGEDSQIPSPEDTDKTNYDFARFCTLMKKVNPSDISFLVRRNTWRKNTVYQPFVDEQDISESNFYVFNETNRAIYKCIESAGFGASADEFGGSLYAPSNLDVGEPFSTNDGYKWKLVTQISLADLEKFSVNGRDETDSYIPIKYINYDPSNVDTEEFLQKQIQDSAVDGSLSAIFLNPEYKNQFKVDNVLCKVNDNYAFLVDDAAIGATAVRISTSSFNELPNVGPLNDLTFRVADGPGVGQTRRIKSSTKVTVSEFQNHVLAYIDALDEGLSAYSTPEDPGSILNILPNVTILGDGEVNDVTSVKNTNQVGAFSLPVFDSSGFLKGFDLIDHGKNYTYANSFLTKGITAQDPTAYPEIPNDILITSLAPKGGHGSNVIRELGVSRLVVKVKLEGNENNRVNATNDFRQIALIKNPEYAKKPIIIRTTYENGDGIDVGDIVDLTVSSSVEATGEVLRKYRYSSDASKGYEFLVSGISGNYDNYDTIDNVPIDSDDGLEFITFLGEENQQEKIIKTSTNISSTQIGPRDIIVGVGDKSTGKPPTLTTAKIKKIDAGDIYVEKINGSFSPGEKVFALTKGGTASGQFVIDEVSNFNSDTTRNTYSTITKLSLESQSNQPLEATSFEIDQLAYIFDNNRNTTITEKTPYKANSFVFDWTVNPFSIADGGGTKNFGTLELVGVSSKNYSVGNYVLYYRKDSPKIPRFARINSIIQSEYAIGSGEIMYVQNFSPIERDIQSEEELNLVIGL